MSNINLKLICGRFAYAVPSQAARLSVLPTTGERLACSPVTWSATSHQIVETYSAVTMAIFATTAVMAASDAVLSRKK